MIDSPENCFTHAATARSSAEGPMLENVRRKHLASAEAWEKLARILLAKPADRHSLRLSKLPEPFLVGPETRPGRTAALDRWENEGGEVSSPD